MSIRIASLVAVAFFNLLTTLFIFSKGFKKKVNFYAGLISLFSALFAVSVIYMYIYQNVFWVKMTWIGMFIMPAYIAFLLYYREKPNPKIIFGFFAGAALLLFLSTSTSLMVKDINVADSWNVDYVPGPLNFLTTVFTVFSILGIAFNLISAYLQADNKIKKQKIRVFIGGSALYTLSGFIGMALLAPLGIKSVFGIIHPADLPIYFSVFWVGTTVYAIIRYRFMEIDTVIHRTVLWLLASIMIIIPLYAFWEIFRRPLFSASSLFMSLVMLAWFYIYGWYRSSIQPRIDHFFRRRKYDYYKVLGELGQKIGTELELESLFNRLGQVLKEVLYIRNMLVLVDLPGQTIAGFAEVKAESYDNQTREEERRPATLPSENKLYQWLIDKKKALEREQIEIDPQYKEIKEVALQFCDQQQLAVLVPLILENKVTGLIGLGKKDNLQPYTIKDLELLAELGKQLGVAVDNALHHEDIVEKERLAEEMKLGREIQSALLPQNNPQVSGLRVYGLMEPAKDIGGDYYDYIMQSTVPGQQSAVQTEANGAKDLRPLTADREPQTPDRLAVVIGDVSGKGVSAGLVMVMARTAIHTISEMMGSPKEILSQTNRTLYRDVAGQKGMTMLYLQWDNKNRKIRYSSAGHEHIIIYRATENQGIRESGGDQKSATSNSPTNSVEVIESGGIMLGVLPEIGELLQDSDLHLSSGDKVVLYTDGITEARNEKDELYTLGRLKAAVELNGYKPAPELIDSLRKEVRNFVGVAEQSDDITMVVMEAE